MSNPFHVGQKVRCINILSRDYSLVVGEIYTVMACGMLLNTHTIQVAYSDGNIVSRSDTHHWYVSRFEAVSSGSVVQPSIPTVAVNDHVCPSCQNNRVSRSEKTCWKCGNPL